MWQGCRFPKPPVYIRRHPEQSIMCFGFFLCSRFLMRPLRRGGVAKRRNGVTGRADMLQSCWRPSYCEWNYQSLSTAPIRCSLITEIGVWRRVQEAGRHLQWWWWCWWWWWGIKRWPSRSAPHTVTQISHTTERFMSNPESRCGWKFPFPPLLSLREEVTNDWGCNFAMQRG